MMDIQKEEKFEALPEIEMMLRENPDIKFENGGYVYHGLNQLTALAVCYVAGAWMAWQAAKAQAVPEGFVLVPKEPTPKMIDSTWDYFEDIEGMSHNKRNEFIYKAMIDEAQEQANG